jgi:probable addiction module antidote protein
MKGMHETFSRYDTAEYLKTEADIAAYLEACAEEAPNNAAFMLKALGTVARAHRLALVPDRD